MDITGGKEDKVNKKFDNLMSWIKTEQYNKSVTDCGYILKGVVLAPNVNQSMSKGTGPVSVVGGEDALQLLGGLRQISRWL